MDADEDALREVTSECKAFSMCGFTSWKTQLQLIDSCYREHSDSVAEILKTGTPCEVRESPIHKKESWTALLLL